MQGVAALRADLKLHQELNEAKGKAVAEARKVVEIAEKKLEEVRKAAQPIFKIVDEIANVLKEYNELTLFFKNWREGIERGRRISSTHQYEPGISMLNEDGNLRSLQALASVLGAQLSRRSLATSVRLLRGENKIQEIQAKIDELKEIPPHRSLVARPIRRVEEGSVKVAKKEVGRPRRTPPISLWAPPPDAFWVCFASQEKATADAVRGIFRDTGNTSKKLMVFDDVIKLVDEDIRLPPMCSTHKHFTPYATQ